MNLICKPIANVSELLSGFDLSNPNTLEFYKTLITSFNSVVCPVWGVCDAGATSCSLQVEDTEYKILCPRLVNLLYENSV